MAKVYPRFVYEGGYGVALAVSTGGIFYNPAKTKPLASYADLWEPRFAKKISLVSTKTTPSVFVVIACAAVATGKPLKEAQYLADQAWSKLEALRGNVLNLYTSDTASLEVAQGEGDLGGIEYSKYVLPYTVKGASIDMCYPKEGAFAGVNCQVLVKGGPNPELGAEWMNRMLSPEVQQPLAEVSLAAPPIEGLEFKPELAKLLAYPQKKMDEMALFSPDWAYVNANRPAWIERYNQIFVQ
jgi:putative spermidine/putrescine transport system substrate-binding protein